MLLTDTAIRSAKSKSTRYALRDGEGLFLEVPPKGKKRWRFRYIFGGKENELSLGLYPDVPLRGYKHESGHYLPGARDLRDEQRRLLAAGLDPSAVRKAAKAPPEPVRPVHTFREVALDWHTRMKVKWTPSHTQTTLRRLEANIFPILGGTSVLEITTPMLLEALRLVESRGAIETAHRIQSICSMVFRYAIQSGILATNPADSLRGALSPVPKNHHAALVEPGQVAGLLRACDSYVGGIIVRTALRLAPLVFVRPGELREARWVEIDWEKGLWNIPGERMKMGEPHIVPLARQAVALLREIQPFTGEGEFIFPSPRSPKRPMSNNAILAALRSMGYGREEMTGHGFRAIARTLLDEVLGAPIELIEHQLAHQVRDVHGRAYNRTKHIPQRMEMMQKWADYLDELKTGKPR